MFVRKSDGGKVIENIIAKNILSKNIFGQKIVGKNSFEKTFSSKIFSKKILMPNIFLKKRWGGGEAPLLPAGPRLISSDSEISA